MREVMEPQQIEKVTPRVLEETDYIDELGGVLPSSVLLEMDIAYVRALANVLKKRDEVVVAQHRLICSLQLEIRQKKQRIERTENALKDLCRDEEVLASLPQHIKDAVSKVGDELLVKEYALELNPPPEEPDFSPFELGSTQRKSELQAKLALEAAQQVNSHGATYTGLECNEVNGVLRVYVKMRAGAGFQLDRANLVRALSRHINPETRIDLHARVDVPL